MNKQALSLAVCIAGAYPLSSGAIGLGDLRSSSHLNQPLNAKIELLSTSVQEAQKIQVRLASTDVFNRVGIDRPAYLNSLTFKSTIQNGKPVILVSSNQPIKEPFLNFLLEVSWPEGQLLKEYTVLLDPPVLLQAGTTTEKNTASVRAEPTKSVGFVKRPDPAPQARPTNRQTQVQVKDGVELATPKSARTSAPQQSRSTQSKYRVKSGDTLYRIASRVKSSGVNADQMMVALFRSNPNAFRGNNLNRLKAGVTLNIPSTSNAKALSNSKAKSLVRKHYSEWKQYRKNLAGKTVPQKQASSSSRNTKKATPSRNQAASKQANKNARLEVMGNNGANKNNAQTSSKVSAAGNARISKLDKQLSLAQEALVTKKRENIELRSRVTELESLVQKKSRLITLKNQQLAKLQASLSNSNQRPVNSNNNANSNSANQAKTPTAPATAQTPTQRPATSVNNNLPAHLANRANQDAGKINRTESNGTPNTPTANNNTAPAINQNTPQTQEENLSPALLAAKRRAAAMQEKAKADSDAALADNTDNTGFKPEKENALLSLLSSPIATAAGAGSILLLLLGWLLLSRRKDKSAASDKENIDAVVDDFSDDFSSLEEELNNEINASDTGNDSFFDDLVDDEPKQKTDTTSNLQTSDVSNALGTDDTDDVLQEADVYIVYGLHEQAEAELKRAIKDNPNKLEYRHKLLENYLASNNKEAFDQQAQEIQEIDGDNKAEIWEKVIEMGRKISPDNVLYSGASSSSSVAAIGAVAAATTAVVASSALADDNTTDTQVTEANAEVEQLDDAIDDFDLDDLLLDDAESSSIPEEENDTFELGNNTVLTDDISELDNLDELDGDLSAFGLDDDFSLDDLEKELSEQSTELAPELEAENKNNVVDFDSMMLDENSETKPSSSKDDLDVANLNLNVGSDSGIDKILPKDTAYSSQSSDDDTSFDDDDDILSFLDLPEDDDELHEAHISTKLDLARAYLDMGDIEGARSTLEEVIVEGSDDQKREAEDLLHQTG